MRYHVLIALAFVTTAQANDLEACLKSPSNYEPGCYAEEMTRQEKSLQIAFQKQLKSIVYDKAAVEEGWSRKQFEEMKKQFSLSQSAWQKYSEAWCRYQASTMNGTGAPLLFVQCKTNMIAERRKQLGD